MTDLSLLLWTLLVCLLGLAGLAVGQSRTTIGERYLIGSPVCAGIDPLTFDSARIPHWLTCCVVKGLLLSAGLPTVEILRYAQNDSDCLSGAVRRGAFWDCRQAGGD